MTDQNLPAERGPDAMSLAASAGIGFGGASGFDLAPQSLGEVVGFSKLMASSGHAIPAHLRQNPGACMAVTIQALGWQMSPFAVALQTYKVGDSIAYMAQVIAAVINSRAGLKHRPLIEYTGEGPTRQCKVTFTFKNGDVRDYQSPMFKDIAIKNSPLWKADVDQQLSYFSLRSCARRHCPEVILGVYDPDELEHAEPVRQVTERPAPVSMRAKLADQTGNQGFDPAHVETETSEKVIDQTASEVVRPDPDPQEEPPEAKTEAEAKDNLAAALASLPKKAAPAPTPEPIPEPEVTGPPMDGADDLIRQNAYDDGFAGEPIEAVLVMCEDEREEGIARESYATGHAARVEKEAAEHAASAEVIEETEAFVPSDPDPLDIAGPAPAGVRYLLASDEPGADGKVALYQDGEVFSRVPAEAAAKHDRYDGHPLPPEAPPEAEVVPEKEAPPAEAEAAVEAPEAPAGHPLKPNGLYQELAAKDSWLQIKPMLTTLYGSAMFKGLSPEDQAATRAHLFGAVVEMKDRTRDPVDWAADAAAFGLWIDWMAAGQDSASDKLDSINGTFQTLQGGKMWKERLTDEQRTALSARVGSVQTKIRNA